MPYEKHTWLRGETITAENLNHLEDGIVGEQTTRASQDQFINDRIDQIIAPTGEAPNPSEITDARIGEDGTVYNTLGTAIRTQVGDLKNALDDYVIDKYETITSPNLINGDNSMESGYVQKNGTITSSTSYVHTDYIPVSASQIIRVYYKNGGVFARHGLRFICAYDDQKSVVSASGTNTPVDTYTVPEGISFLRISTDSNKTEYMVTADYEATEYEEYGTKIAIKEDFLTEESEKMMQSLVNGEFRTKDMRNNYGVALPISTFRQTIGLSETWYYDCMVTPKAVNVNVGIGSQYYERIQNGLHFANEATLDSSNGYTFNAYDALLIPIASYLDHKKYGFARKIVNENLSDCTLLAIGDSTVDHDTMTATLLSHFTEQGHTLTLLGTLGDGSGTNKNEGRAGWKATDYLTDRQYDGITNPFYNPSTETFDFNYYMTNQGYSSVDFVVLQLGINDLYNVPFDETDNVIMQTWSAIKTMIDSIMSYSVSAKIILNLPTTPNSDATIVNGEFLYRNKVIRYNEYAQSHAKSEYTEANVRCSYCHLILDSDTEIRDNVHPTSVGYEKMALEVINQINCWQAGV